jgi:CDP-4-dehydro-6-deoxyglucose reductase, E1
MKTVSNTRSTLPDLINSWLAEIEEQHPLYPYLYNLNREVFDPETDVVYYSGPYWTRDEITAIVATVLGGKWLSAGENVHKFEVAFSKKFRCGHSLMVNSGSSANLVMVAALKKWRGWNDGDEVIVSPVGFPTTISPIVQNGLRPVFADITFEDLNFDLDQVEQLVGPRTKAILLSPVLGNPPDIGRLVDMTRERCVDLVLDNCDSLGGKWDGQFLSEFAVASSCSFYPAHHITTGEGGMVSSVHEDLVTIARSIAWWGRGCYCVGAANLLPCGTCGERFGRWLEGYDEEVDHKYVFTNMGYNLKPMDLQGAIGRVQLKRFDDIHARRRENWGRIAEILEKTIEGVRIPGENSRAETSWFGVPVVCADRPLKHRLVAHLEEHRIQTRNYFAGNLLRHPAYSHLSNAPDFPNAELVLDRVFFLGCSPTISDVMIDHIATVCESFNYDGGSLV